MQRMPQQHGDASNKNGVQAGRIPANIVMGRQPLKQDAPPAGEQSERPRRASRKDRAAAQMPSNTLRRAESQAENQELRDVDPEQADQAQQNSAPRSNQRKQ